MNGYNNVVDNNTGKTYGLSVGWNPTKRVSLAQNYMAGPEGNDNNSDWRQLWDTVATYSPNSKLSFIVNYDYGRGDRIITPQGQLLPLVSAPVFWTGVAGYVKYAFHPKYALASRYEYYDDHNGFTTGSAQNLHGFTATFERIVASHILSRMEFRRDSSNQPSFLKGNNQAVTAQSTATVGLVFMIDSREDR